MSNASLSVHKILGLLAIAVLFDLSDAAAAETEEDFLSRDTVSDVASDSGVATGAAYVRVAKAEAEKVVKTAGAQSVLGETGTRYAKTGLNVVGKVARFAPLVLDGLQEAGETKAALAEKDYGEAFAQFVGGAANVGVSALGSMVTDANSIRCASLGAWRGGWRGGARAFGQCTAAGAAYTSIIANATEDAVQDVVRAGVKRDKTSGAKGRPSIVVGGIVVGGGRRTTIEVRIDGSQTTIARSRSNAASEVGVSRTGGTSVRAQTKGVSTFSGRGGNAYTGVGVANSAGDDVDVKVTGSILTKSSGSGDATLRVGAGTGDARVNVKGPIVTIANGGDTSTVIGGRTTIKGYVLNTGGRLFVGDGACKAVRKGRCCIAIHRRLCVWNILPRGKYGCPPRYRPYRGACDLYSDFQHRIDR